MNEEISEVIRRKDATSFIEKNSVVEKDSICLDEWLFAFSKLYFEEIIIFQKFLQDYRKTTASKGPFGKEIPVPVVPAE